MPEIEANGITIHYELCGPADAPVVLLSNSLGTRLEMWEPQLSALSQRYRVLRYDSRGHGRSSAPKGPYTIELLASDAIGLLDALRISEAHFCGLSMGGMVGQVLGARHGDRVRSLTLCSTACHVTPKAIWDERIEAVRKRRHGGGRRWRGRALVHRALPRGAHDRGRAGAPDDPRDAGRGLCRLLRRDPRHGPARDDPQRSVCRCW